jgi:hypothetical protein
MAELAARQHGHRPASTKAPSARSRKQRMFFPRVPRAIVSGSQSGWSCKYAVQIKLLESNDSPMDEDIRLATK